MDTKVAEIGQAELDKQENEQSADQAQGQNAEGQVDGTVEADPMEHDTPSSSTPKDAPDPQRFDLSPRGSIPKRRIENDDVEDDSPDKRLRPRSPTISYKTDAESVGSNMDDGDIGIPNEIDSKILSSSIMGVDITEVYSPERVAQEPRKFGLVSGSSMDLTNGWDFNRDDHKRLAWKRVGEEAPIF